MVLRKKDVTKCPFGLEIPVACKCVGNKIRDLEPIPYDDEEITKEKIESLTKKNKKLAIVNNNDKGRCPFASQIPRDSDSVICNFGENGEGRKPVNIPPAPSMIDGFFGFNYTGLISTPMYNSIPPGSFGRASYAMLKNFYSEEEE